MSRYVFDPEELQEAANLGQGQSVGRRRDLIYDDLRQRHPDHLPAGTMRTFIPGQFEPTAAVCL